MVGCNFSSDATCLLKYAVSPWSTLAYRDLVLAHICKPSFWIDRHFHQSEVFTVVLTSPQQARVTLQLDFVSPTEKGKSQDGK